MMDVSNAAVQASSSPGMESCHQGPVLAGKRQSNNRSQEQAERA